MNFQKTSKNTREEILDCAFSLIHKNGFRDTGISEILEKAKLTKGAFYHYFSTKSALGHAIIDEILTNIIEEFWIHPIQQAKNPIDAMKQLFISAKLDRNSVKLGCPLNNLATEMSAVDEDFRLRIEKVYTLWIDGYAKILQTGQKNGLVTQEVNAKEAAQFIVSAFAGCISRAKNSQNTTVLKVCFEQLIRYLDTLRS